MPDGVPTGVTVLQQPLDQIYLVAAAAMDYFDKLNAIDCITLLCFHIGAAAAYFAVTWWYIRGALAVLPLIAWAFFLSVCERRHEALAEEPETIPDSSAHPTSNA